MFMPVAMQRVSVYLVQEDTPAAALALAECGAFNPQVEETEGSPLPERPGKHYQQLHASAQRRLDKIVAHLELQPTPEPSQLTPRPVTEEELRQLDTQLGEIWHECSWCEENERRLQEETRQVAQLSDALQKFAALDIDLELLQGKLRFLDVHIGTVADADVRRLRQAVGLIGYSLTVYLRSEKVAYVALAGLAGVEQELHTVLEAASFHRLELPPEFRDHPSKVKAELQARSRRVAEEQAALAEHIRNGREKHGQTLEAAARTLVMAAPYAELADVLQSSGGLTRMGGWVPKDRVEDLREILTKRLDLPFLLTARDPRPEEQGEVPSAMRHSRLLRPFATLVRNYGIPRYGEIDPTWLFALTFIAMFGMMFGDVGHGALIAVAGVVLRRKLRGFAPFLVAAGVSSTVFGFLYGSVFGYEDLIHAVWMSPLSDPILMLRLALYWGIGFILLATGITVRNRLVAGQVASALLDGKGLAGAALYLGVLYAAFRWVQVGQFGLLEQAAVFLPLLVILVYKWLKFQAPVGERILVVVIEGFETFMSYVANTLSFLRVAAFSLNHVALAVAVFTLADMMDTTGHWITVVLGNAFILILEGAIVAIQVLRLEYYEGFSRFFSGDGREFRPLVLATEDSYGRKHP